MIINFNIDAIILNGLTVTCWLGGDGLGFDSPGSTFFVFFFFIFYGFFKRTPLLKKKPMVNTFAKGPLKQRPNEY
jgi:hypothetical protein